jgi:hypothetical protein
MRALRPLKRRIAKAIYTRRQSAFAEDRSFTSAYASCAGDRNTAHQYFSHYYRHVLPEALREHRRYFEVGQRGFGEESFHAMWFVLLREFKPVHCLEIGVYRGQVLSLWALIGRTLQIPVEATGISPFSSMGDSVSVYATDVDYLDDTLRAHDQWQLQHPTLIKALSSEPQAVEAIARQKWDLAYIDGNHDYDVALEDYRRCRDALAPRGLLVLDDASLNTTFVPPSFSFAGHPGPSRVAQEFAHRELKFLGAVGHNNVFQLP